MGVKMVLLERRNGGLPFTELIRQIVFDTFPIKRTEDLTGPSQTGCVGDGLRYG